MRRTPLRLKILYFLAFITTLIYLIWRGIFTLPVNESWFALIFGVLLWLSEIVSNLTAMILIWSKNQSFTLEKSEVDPALYPDVDVLIATHNEDVELVLKTVNAAVNMKYPDPNKVHIYISDDMNRPQMKALADQFGVGYFGLSNNKHAKSGNYNNALSKSNSPLVATFDADMIPYSDFLLETVPYFVANKLKRDKDDSVKPIGLIQTPQSFYNVDLFQFNLFSESTITNEQDFFSREVNLLNNASGAAIYTGSNTLISRQAIVDVGGFPTDTITEDFQLGAMINAKGYLNYSTEDPKASGLTPSDIPSVIKQRKRWGRGVIQSVHNINLLFNKGLSFSQKLVYLNSYLYWWSFLRRLLYVMAPILFTVFEVQVVDANFWNLLLIWLPSYTLTHLSMESVTGNIRTQRWGEIQEMIFAPFLALPIFLQAIGIKETKFKVTNKDAKTSRKDLIYIIPHAILLILAIYGLFKFNYGKYGSEIMYGSIITFWLLSHTINLIFACLYFLGRPIYRHTERFFTKSKIEFKNHQLLKDMVSYDISEEGISFMSDFPYYFSPNEAIQFRVSRKNYAADVEGEIVRVWSNEDKWFYGIQLGSMTESNYLQYLLIVYDGFNQNIRQTIDPWITIVDTLIGNIQRRELNRSASKNVSIYPNLTINQDIDWSEVKVLLNHFNYQTMQLTIPDLSIVESNHQLIIDDCIFDLELSESLTENRYIYKVINVDEIANSLPLQKLIQSWLIAKEVEI